MTITIRNITIAFLFSPLIVLIYLTAIFIGKSKAITYWGRVGTFLAKHLLRFLVPEIENAGEFDKFKAKMKANFWLWRPLLGFRVAEETNDIFKFYVWNCPFCEVLNTVGLSDLSPHVCEGDWAKANENRNKWLFERTHQIGTGDSFCDHTYLRKK
jgi:hypothetical protein